MHGDGGQDPALAALAAAWGMVIRYPDAFGVVRAPAAEAVLAVLRALGAPVERIGDCADAIRSVPGRNPEPVTVAWNGEIGWVPGPAVPPSSRARVRIRFEDGSERTAEAQALPGLEKRETSRFPVAGPFPLGIHEVQVESSGRLHATRVIAAPRVAWLPPHPRNWGVFVPLHAVGPGGTSLPGSYSDLRELLRWVGHAGGLCVGSLPLLPTFLDDPFEPSPYAPISRLVLSELFVDAEAAARSLSAAAPSAATAPLDTPAEIDYRAAWQRTRSRLGALAADFFRDGGRQSRRLRQFLNDRPEVEDYARFRAALAREGRPWRAWPVRQRDGRLEPGDFDRAEHEFHLFAALCAEEQMTAAVSGPGSARPYLDLPLGVHPDGYDTWRFRALFAEGVGVGAPPDPFFERGQNWGFPPLIPAVARAQGHQYFLNCLRLQLRYAGVLRLDHVMALEREYWVPAGFDATDGVYVKYPRDELIALLTLESHRHEAMIVGEDLGTVTPSIRTAMGEHALQRMFVVQFEVNPERAPPLATPDASAVASIGTHDLPPFAGWLEGVDLDQRLALGVISAGTCADLRAQRRRAAVALCRALAVPEEADRLHEALLEALARGPARLLMLNLEDCWLETRPQNVPGTTTEQPNWRCRTPHDVHSLQRDAVVARLLADLHRVRTGGNASLEGST